MLPSSGPIAFSDINVELGRPWNNYIELNDPAVRALAGKPSGPIGFADLHGKASEIFEAFSLYVGEVGQQVGGDKVAAYSPAQRGYFLYFADSTGINFARGGSLSPATFRGYPVGELAEQHGDRTSETTLQPVRVDRFYFRLNVRAGQAYLKKIQVFYGSTLHYEFYSANAVYELFDQFTTWSWPLPNAWHLSTGATYTVRIHYE